MRKKLTSPTSLLTLGLILSGVFLPTLIGDANNRLIAIPSVFGLLVTGWAIAKLSR
jgi:hypothetical protein